MQLPPDTSLPFFAYGVFKPGELAFLRIKEFVRDCYPCSVKGAMRLRDGLPIASLSEDRLIHGFLILFRNGLEELAFKRIVDLEPDKQYHWVTVEMESGLANLLEGKSPMKGSVEAEGDWSGIQDPLFTAAIEVVTETLEANREPDFNMKPLFKLEMAYLLLWTSIERYASLRYHLKDKATEKIWQIADEPAFCNALKRNVNGSRTVQRADDPTKSCLLTPDRPKKTLEDYYQLRSNLVHRGKGVFSDHARVMASLEELLKIFEETRSAAFRDSAWI